MNKLEISALSKLSKEQLIDVLTMFGQNLLSVDGWWFAYLEEKFGFEPALEIDAKVWETVSPREARRIKKTLNITGDGIPALLEALPFWLWFGTLEYEITEVTDERFLLSVTSCPSQKGRLRQGKGEFACQQVEENYLRGFSSTIDPRLKVKCLLCPPDEHPDDLWCKWEFKLE